MAHLWSGRFAGDPDAALFEFGRSFSFDRRLFDDDVTGSLAWADALEKAGVLTAADRSRIRTALEEIRSFSRPTRRDVTRTSTHLSSASSSRGRGTRGAGSTPADRETNRFQSICACT